MSTEENKTVVRRFWEGCWRKGHLAAGNMLIARVFATIDVMLVAALLATLGVACGASDSNRPLTATLDGAPKPDGPPTAKDPDGSGTAIIRLNAEKGEICWELTVSGIASANGAHIHYKQGSQAVTLAPPTNGFSSGCTSAGSDLVQAILQNPAGYYVVVHNDEFPSSALDGRLSK